MSWMQKLCMTYDNNLKYIGNPNDAIPLLPLYHTTQNAQVHIVLDGDGFFLRASIIQKEDAQTIAPATEDSAGRSGSKIAPHPLCDTLQYVAGDYLIWGGNPRKKKNESGYTPYLNALHCWVDWSNDRKLRSLLTYLSKSCLIKDLLDHKVLFANDKGQLIEKWTETSPAPPIFKVIKQAKKKGQYEAFCRFSVEIPGDKRSRLWEDPCLRELWVRFYSTQLKIRDLCMVVGEETSIAFNHPKNIRYPGDGAKLITSNDTEGFTFLGRFTNAKEACCVGTEATQKAHSALRWLINRQGYSKYGQAIVAWATSGAEVPDPLADPLSILGEEELISDDSNDVSTAQNLAIKLKNKIAGYKADLGDTNEVVVIGLDSATPGRMAITFYRELTGSEFLKRLEKWHDTCTWVHDYGYNPETKKRIRFVGAPAPKDIAEAAYGHYENDRLVVDDKIKKSTVERLMPCIIDSQRIPRNLVASAIQRATNRIGFKKNEDWNKTLSIACALYKKLNEKEGYSMALDENRKTRDYLYGRLLALADSLEQWALNEAGEVRQTNAARFMQRFADYPFSTWKLIELSLSPYKARLGGKSQKRQELIDRVHAMFDPPEDYTSDKKLSGEFLLGYHCQRAALWKNKDGKVSEQKQKTIFEEE
jgi:CRISPR-associated protein Csd1